MSDTPRTDALYARWYGEHAPPTPDFVMNGKLESTWHHGRTLERELAEAAAEIERLKIDGDNVRGSYQCARSALMAMVGGDETARPIEFYVREVALLLAQAQQSARDAERQRDEAIAATIERCAKVCDERSAHFGGPDAKNGPTIGNAIYWCAAAIRALAPGDTARRLLNQKEGT